VTLLDGEHSSLTAPTREMASGSPWQRRRTSAAWRDRSHHGGGLSECVIFPRGLMGSMPAGRPHSEIAPGPSGFPISRSAFLGRVPAHHAARASITGTNEDRSGRAAIKTDQDGSPSITAFSRPWPDGLRLGVALQICGTGQGHWRGESWILSRKIPGNHGICHNVVFTVAPLRSPTEPSKSIGAARTHHVRASEYSDLVALCMNTQTGDS